MDQQAKLENISYIIDDILLEPDVDCSVVLASGRMAAEDDYLYKLMVDYMKETELDLKDNMLKDILDYTQEFLRRASI